MASAHWRPLAPATNESRRAPGRSRKRRTLNDVACFMCREKKTKCDSARPTCSRCKTLAIVCQYDVGEGVTRAERFKVMKNRQVTWSANLESLVDLLRTGSDVAASTVLARLRLGDRVEDIVQPLQTDSIEATPEPTGERCGGPYPEFRSFADASNPNSEVTAVHGQLSTQGQHPTQVQRLVTETTFLSVVLDMNDLRLTKTTTETSAVHTRTRINLLETSPSVQPEMSSQDDTLTEGSFVLAQKWNRESATTQDDVQACFANFFGNLPTSSAILANHQPPMIQQQQLRSLSIPVWAMLCSNKNLDPGSILPAFTTIRCRINEMLQQGVSWQDAIGEQPNVSALLSEDGFRKASLLSQWASSMVHSVKNEANNLTCIGSMYFFWYIMRWMIFPSPRHYEDLPDFARPTPYQIFVPHNHSFDFVLWPKLRDIAVQTTNMQERLEWLFDYSTYVRCDWPHTIAEALCKDPIAGFDVLTDAAKAHIFDLANWSTAPSLRAFVPNVDAYVTIWPYSD